MRCCVEGCQNELKDDTELYMKMCWLCMSDEEARKEHMKARNALGL